MSPIHAVDDVRDGVARDAEAHGDVPVALTTGRQGADLYDLWGMELLLAEGVPAALVDAVVDVVFLSAEKQVIGPDAARVIAGMQDVQPIRHGAVGEFPCQPMGIDARAILAHNLTVAVRPDATASHGPAARSFDRAGS